MNVLEKRDFIHSHLHQVKEPVIDDFYNRMVQLFQESMLEESEDDIKNSNLMSHESLKEEVKGWRSIK